LDIKYYLTKINAQIKHETKNHINIKCPICNEGNSPFKSRGYVLINNDFQTYYCHNCLQEGISFFNFLSQVDASTAHEFKQNEKNDKLRGLKEDETFARQIQDVFKDEEEKTLFEVKSFTNAIYTVKDKSYEYPLEPLNDDALIYLLGRGFTRDEVKDFKFCKESNDVVIPFWYNKNLNEVYGMQMRNITEKRFHIQVFSNPKVWNIMYCLSLPKGSDIYVFESVFDALSAGFKNSISTLGRTLGAEIKEMLKDHNLIFVLDADKSGDDSVLKYSKEGFKCVVHEKDMYNFKDLSKLREMGVSIEEIQSYIKKRTFSALKSQMLIKMIHI
jgi:DNA primase